MKFAFVGFRLFNRGPKRVSAKMLLTVLLMFLFSGFITVQAADGEEGENSNDLSSCKICGQANLKKEIRTSIVRGDIVEPPYKYPWMVAIRVKSNKTNCAGAIISEYFVLTAAHCITEWKTKKRLNPRDIRVSFLTSTYDVKDGPAVEEVIPHRGHLLLKQHDIGLLKLKEKIMCDEFKNPVCLPPNDFALPENAVLTLSAWGATTAPNSKVDAVTSDALHEGQFTIAKFDTCPHPSDWSEDPPPEGMFYCLWGMNNESACYGDSGGPTFYKQGNEYYAIAVQSFGRYCSNRFPTYFTSVLHHLRWIHENMKASLAKTHRHINGTCTDPMGFENYQLPDSFISVSSSRDAKTGPTRIRLNTYTEGNFSGGWLPATNDHEPRVRIDFEEKRNLTGILTQGLDDDDLWINSYKVRYSLDNITWNDVKEKETDDLVFRGNNDRNSVVLRMFKEMITTRYLEIIILDYHTLPALRMEVLGCFIPYKLKPEPLPGTVVFPEFPDIDPNQVIEPRSAIG